MLLLISSLGIYIHALFLSISLGFPWVIVSLLVSWWRTRDEHYFAAVKTATGVLGLNFALGAATGTLVEFGLVQAWPGSIFVIATFGFIPLTLELIAFVGEIVLLILFIVTLGKARASGSIFIMSAYLAMAVLSGALITTVNSWLNVPWGTGSLASNLYPFLPGYGPETANLGALVQLKLELVRAFATSGSASQVLQNAGLARSVGLALSDPYIAFLSPYNQASILHNVNAAMIVGVSIALVGYAHRYFKTGDFKYERILRAILPVLFILLVVQPFIFGDFMGKMVASNQPTKLALMEGASTTRQNPLVGFLAYGDPSHPILGFESFREWCNGLAGKTLDSLDLKQQCLSDLSRAEARVLVVNTAYYLKVAMGVVALVSLLGLEATVFKLGILSKLVHRIFSRVHRTKLVFAFSFLVLAGAIASSMLGWFVREGGRKPWTVYGILHPEEIITAVSISPIVLFLFVLTFAGVATIGLVGMYVVATRPLKFIELLRKGAGVE